MEAIGFLIVIVIIGLIIKAIIGGVSESVQVDKINKRIKENNQTWWREYDKINKKDDNDKK